LLLCAAFNSYVPLLGHCLVVVSPRLKEFEVQEFEELLVRSQEADLTMAQIELMFPFPLDGFQRDAVEKSINGSSVVVCAPTGAGKTAIAVAAAVPVLAAGKRVIYTTPLKALSNQKLYELQVRSTT
jgi:superfamily II RNA helicase